MRPVFRVAVSQLERRGGFPLVAEAVHGGELVDTAGGAHLGEQATTADGLQLAGITNQNHPPVLLIGEHGEAMQRGGADHARLVHHERGARREPIPLMGRSVNTCGHQTTPDAVKNIPSGFTNDGPWRDTRAGALTRRNVRRTPRRAGDGSC